MCLFEHQMELSLHGMVRSSCFPLHSIHLIHVCLDPIQLAEVVGSHWDKLLLLIDPEETTEQDFLLGWGFMHSAIWMWQWVEISLIPIIFHHSFMDCSR
jgi:hypothetical protein